MIQRIKAIGWALLVGLLGGLFTGAVAHGKEVADAMPAPGLLDGLAGWSDAAIAMGIITPFIVTFVKAIRMVVPMMTERHLPVPPLTIGRTTLRAKLLTVSTAAVLGVLGGFFITVPSSFPNADAFRFVLGAFAGLSAVMGHHVATLPFSKRRKAEKAAHDLDPTKTGSFPGVES